jgi:mannose/fructose/N-acetylgalactosamine-specific phosphotransferase system component IIC
VDYLVVALVAGLAAVERKGFLQAMLARPIALAPITGLALGDPSGGLLIGAPLELLWLGAVNMGASLPPNEALGTVAVTAGAVIAGKELGTGATPAVAALAMALVGVLATVGRTTDRAIEEWNVRLASRAEALLDRGAPIAAMRANLYGLVPPFAVSALLAPAAAALAAWVIPGVLHGMPLASGPLAYGWAALTGVAAAAGAQAFRSQHGVGLFAGATAFTVAVGWLAGGIR